MHVTRSRMRVIAGTVAALGVVAVASVSTASADSTRASANPFAHYGNITLNVTSADNQDPGPEPVIKELIAQFEKKYPNVKINVTFKGFGDYMKVIQLSLNGNSAPDVSEGNQSYATDALLVKAKLIIPLDKYSKQYGWDKLFSPGEEQQFRWTPDGKTFGRETSTASRSSGSRRGSSTTRPSSRPTASIPSKMPTTFAAFQTMLAQGRRQEREGRSRARDREQGRLRVAARLGHDPGRLHPGAERARLDLPQAGRDVRQPDEHPVAERPDEVGQGRRTSAATTTRSARTTPLRPSPRARASSTWAGTGRPR